MITDKNMNINMILGISNMNIEYEYGTNIIHICDMDIIDECMTNARNRRAD